MEASPTVSETPNATETPTTETPIPSETPVTETPEASPVVPETPTEIPTELPTETPIPLPSETPVPIETATEIPTVAPAPRTVEVAAVADTSVTHANPDDAQPGYAIGTLRAGGPETALTYISFAVADIGDGVVTEAYLVVTGTAGGGPGGVIGLVPGYLVDENGTYRTLPTEGIEAAFALDGSPSNLGLVGEGETVQVDVTRSVQANGQYTFVILGDPAQILELSSREGGAAPKLVLVIQD